MNEAEFQNFPLFLEPQIAFISGSESLSLLCLPSAVWRLLWWLTSPAEVPTPSSQLKIVPVTLAVHRSGQLHFKSLP